jgi:sortase (surface protein transpeptidase)
VVTAHVDWLQEKGVFHDLGRMRPGDAVMVDRADGVALMFRVTRTEQYSKSRFPSQEVYGDTDGAELRLITCAGRFDNAARSYLDNLVVYARLVGVS